jgi:hypothetical protein
MMITADRSRPKPGGAGRDSGSLTLFVAITATVVVVFFGVVLDLSQQLQIRHDANIAAEEAARAAVGQIDRNRAYGDGSFVIDRQAAIHTASQYLHTAGVAGSATIVGARRIRVRVRITRQALFLPMIGVSTLHVDAAAVADLATGITKEDR